MAQTKTLLTEKGFQELSMRLSKLKTKLAQIEKAIFNIIINDGVFDEYYSERAERRLEIVSEIRDLEDTLRNSEVVSSANDPIGHSPKEEVNIGDVVTVAGSDVAYHYQIVSSVEANPLEGKISAESPIGSSLVGRRIGENIKISLPKGDIEVKITEID